MPKIHPTTILPYTKTSIDFDSTANTDNITNALKGTPPQKVENKKEVFGLLSAASSYISHIKTANNFHSGVALKAWRKRKN